MLWKMVSKALLKPCRQDSQPFPHPPRGLSCHRRWSGWTRRTRLSQICAGWAWSPVWPTCALWQHSRWPSPAPRFGWQASYPCSSCRWVSPSLIPRQQDLHSPSGLDVKWTDPWPKKPPKIKILLMTPGLEPGIDLLACWLFLCLLCTWKDRGKRHLCSWSLNQSSQVPEVSWLLSGTVFRDLLRLLVAISLQIERNQSRIINQG